MDWLSQNWIWVLVFAAFIGMHLFGHGGHGGHGGGHGGHGSGGEKPREPADKDEQVADRPHGHHH